MITTNLARLREFVITFGELVSRRPSESILLDTGGKLLADLVQHDDWLPDDYAVPNPSHYQQYLLHCDSRERFSVVSFVWGAGQKTPIHNHRVWGLVGALRGAETSEQWRRLPNGPLEPVGEMQRLDAGEIDSVSPRIGDIHRVANAYADRISISVHVYGANIGRVQRSIFEEDGTTRPFISGYANKACPNIWSA